MWNNSTLTWRCCIMIKYIKYNTRVLRYPVATYIDSRYSTQKKNILEYGYYTKNPFSQPFGSCSEEQGREMALSLCTKRMFTEVSCGEMIKQFGWNANGLEEISANYGCDYLLSKTLGLNVENSGTDILINLIAGIAKWFSDYDDDIDYLAAMAKIPNCQSRVFNKCNYLYKAWEELQQRPVELYNECQEKFNKVNEIQTEIDRLNKKLENLNQLQANI